MRAHATWFEDRPTTAAQLAAELQSTAVRVPPDVRDATIYTSHAAFSGHVVEIALSRTGAVTYVGLLG